MLPACQSKPSTADQTTSQSPADSSGKPVPPESTPEVSAGATPNDFLIVPGERVGPVTRTTSEADLITRLGASVVTAGDTLYGPEGEEFLGTTLYKGTADALEVIYADTQRTKPKTITIMPQTGNEAGNPTPTRWRTTNGLGIGTTLNELEKRNGKPFQVWGFDWDYGGTVSNWQGGKLTQSGKQAFMSLMLGPTSTQRSAQAKSYATLLGDTEFLSSLPAMQKLNPFVRKIQLTFER